MAPKTEERRDLRLIDLKHGDLVVLIPEREPMHGLTMTVHLAGVKAAVLQSNGMRMVVRELGPGCVEDDRQKRYYLRGAGPWVCNVCGASNAR